MGTIIEFPADAASRRPGPTMDGAPREGMGIILILPVVRIEREPDKTSGGSGPEEGTAPGRRSGAACDLSGDAGRSPEQVGAAALES